MLLKSLDIYVYRIDNNGAFDAIGQINQYTSIIWPSKFIGYSEFELNAPITPENKILIKENHVIWCGGDNAAIIEIIQVDTNEYGQKVYKVKGKTLEKLLTSRIIWGTYNCVNKNASSVMYEIVNNNCVNPLNGERKIPFLECAGDEQLGREINFQKTGSEVYEALESIANDANLGFDVLFRPREKKLVFKVIQGTDRTDLTQQDAVVFSTDLEDIMTSSYYKNIENIKNVALVAGEGDGVDRKKFISGNDALRGFERKELYIDARDIQSEVQEDNGETTSISDDDYMAMLDNRGKEKLAERTSIESFEAEMRNARDIQYRYGVDYNRGDKVIVQDADIGVQVLAIVSEVTENYDDEYELDITFGFSSPTLIQKIKQQIK